MVSSICLRIWSIFPCWFWRASIAVLDMISDLLQGLKQMEESRAWPDGNEKWRVDCVAREDVLKDMSFYYLIISCMGMDVNVDFVISPFFSHCLFPHARRLLNGAGRRRE